MKQKAKPSKVDFGIPLFPLIEIVSRGVTIAFGFDYS